MEMVSARNAMARHKRMSRMSLNSAERKKNRLATWSEGGPASASFNPVAVVDVVFEASAEYNRLAAACVGEGKHQVWLETRGAG